MTNKKLEAIKFNIETGIAAGLIQLTLDDTRSEGRFIQIRKQRFLNFASCSYLGLETDPRVIESIVAAARRYGSQFSASRAYLSISLYEEVEARLAQICHRPVIVTPTTTLAHQSALPVLIHGEDAVILDQQVHNSVSAACRALKVQGSYMEMVSHSHMERLERKIQRLKSKHKRVWYLMDGLYSMAGDIAPLSELAVLLDRYEQFHIYADDAHGGSWQGQRGQGAVLDKFALNPKVTVALSLNKSFAAAGGVLALGDEAAKRDVRNLGETLTFSGPIQPPMLGALRASVDIHLTTELADLQSQLVQNIRHFNAICAEKGLQLESSDITPIRYIRIPQDPVKLLWMCRTLMEKGFYICVAGFPSVAKNRAGLRMTITRHHKKEDIEALLNSISDLIDQKIDDCLKLHITEEELA